MTNKAPKPAVRAPDLSPPLYRWRTRSLVAVIAAGFGFTLLWTSGVTWQQIRAWLPRPNAVARVAERPNKAAPPPAVVNANGPSASPGSLKGLPGSDSSISKVPQRLLLTGTIQGKSPEDGLAMIGVARENPQTYAPGALLANGSRLKEIHPKYVLLERGGQVEKLFLDGSPEEKAGRRSEKSLAIVGGPQLVVAAVATVSEALTDYIVPNPVFDGQTVRGYEVFPGRFSAPFAQMGLKPGDVITNIDAVTLNEPVQSMEAFRTLTSGGNHEISGQRKAGAFQLSLDSTVLARDIEQRRQPASGPAISMNLPR
jgi:general secretion pathway protein C